MVERQRYLAILAGGTLAKLLEIASSARRALQRDGEVRADFLAAGNTFNEPAIMRTLVGDAHAARTTAEEVLEEPAIARVVTSEEGGRQRVFFINRLLSWDPTGGVIGYRSPLGRLASIPAGEKVTVATPSGEKTFLILERATFRPTPAGGEWDAVNSNVERDGSKPVTVLSFRALLPPDGPASGSFIEEQLAEERAAENVREGIRRGVITKMALRDRPILDRIQDEIFRLPLNSRLLVLGPPGSGKTTTLIRRLGQKLDIAALEESERAIVERAAGGQLPHDQSWLMFTPAELLKQYVKEAFAREEIPAPDQRIKTWADYGRDLARNTFRILKSGTGRGSFVLREKETFLLEATLDQQPDWFEDFESWQDSDFWSDLEREASNLATNTDLNAAAVGRRLSLTLKAAAGKSIAEKVLAIAAFREDVQALASEKRDSIRAKVDAAINLQINQDRTLLDQIAKLLEALAEAEEASEEQEAFDEDEDEVPVSRSGRLAAYAAFTAALRAQARSEITKRRLSPDSRNAKLLEWLGDRSLAREDRLVVGENIQVEISARRFLTPARRYIEGVPARYRRYRKQRQEDQKWYRADEIEASRISALEMDMLLLVTLRATKALLSEGRVNRDLGNPAFVFLSQIRDLHRNQVLVDEAADFSPIQLACMESLCTSDFRSFFACGDFNQRITEWGVRSEEEFQWAVPDIRVRTIATTYRHSKQLNEFAGELVKISGGISRAILPGNVDAEGVAPSLGTRLRNPREIAAWLAKRIGEVEGMAQQMPSIAVLVNSETEVNPIAEALNEALVSQNIRAIPCSNGQSMGQGTDVRVFDVQHIKGLEFEAVFFVSIDRFAEQNPKLFDKYLYVGTTRAATYLGLTCEGGSLPAKLESLQSSFVNRWQT